MTGGLSSPHSEVAQPIVSCSMACSGGTDGRLHAAAGPAATSADVERGAYAVRRGLDGVMLAAWVKNAKDVNHRKPDSDRSLWWSKHRSSRPRAIMYTQSGDASATERNRSTAQHECSAGKVTKAKVDHVDLGLGDMQLPGRSVTTHARPCTNIEEEEKIVPYLAIFSSSLSRGSTARLLSYISCTSPAACMLLKM